MRFGVISLVCIALASSSCRSRAVPTRPLVWKLTHPVETPWSASPGGAYELRFVGSVGSNAARDMPATDTFPCIELEVRAAGTPVATTQPIRCDKASSPATAADMIRATEALLGVPRLSWSHGHSLVATGPGWAQGLVVLPSGSSPGWRAGSIMGKPGDPLLPGLKCDAWGERNDCVIQEYEASAARLPGVGRVLGFLSDTPERSAVLLVTGTGLSAVAIEHAVLAANPGPHLPLRVRIWPSLPPAPTSEDLWAVMDAEGRLPP